MAAWAKRQNEVRRVEQLFQGLKCEWEAGIGVPSRIMADAYAIRLQAWSKTGNPEKTTSVFNEWVKHVDNHELPQKPKTVDFNAVIDSWTKSISNQISTRTIESGGKAAKNAERGLLQMLDLAERREFDCYPDVYSFTSVISAHAKSGVPGAGERALQVFRKQQKLAKATNRGSLHPNVLTYVEVIVALIRCSRDRSRSKSAILQLFDEMRELPPEVFAGQYALPRLRKIKGELEIVSTPWKTQLIDEYERLEKCIMPSSFSLQDQEDGGFMHAGNE